MMNEELAQQSQTPQEARLCNMDLPLHGIFYPLGYPVEIITNDPIVLEAANESFGHLGLCRTSSTLQIRIGVSEGGGTEWPPEPTRREYKHLFSLVADVENQALLDRESCVSFIWVQKATVRHKLYFRYHLLEKTVYTLLSASVVTDLHAACVSKNKKGVLLFGDSGAGKSTLSYACSRAGWTYTSDDTSYLINNADAPYAIGHSHRIRFRPSAKALFPELEDRELTRRLEGKPSMEIATSEFPGLITAAEAEIHFVLYLNRNPSGASKLIPLPEGTAQRRACEALYSAGKIRKIQEKALQVFSGIAAYELQYSDLKGAISQLDLLTQDAYVCTDSV